VIEVIRPHYPAGPERVYRAFLVELVNVMHREAARVLVPAYAAALVEHKQSLRRDAWPDMIESALQVITMTVSPRLHAGHRLVVEVAESVSGFSKKQWQRVAEAQTGVNLFRAEPWLVSLLDSWSKENAKLITSIPERYLDRVSQLTQSMVRQGRSVADYRKELARTYDLTRARAQLIARTEMAKLNGAITKSRQVSLGIREYTWFAAADERVRDSHRVLNNKICRWDNPSVYRTEADPTWRKRSTIGAYIGDPGEDFQCRCVAGGRVNERIEELLRAVG
jgi:SPP1 gp7 family putative phage head morphogenesis protein